MLFVKYFYVKTTNPLMPSHNALNCSLINYSSSTESFYKIHRSWETTTLTRRFLPVRRATWRPRPPPSQLPEQLRPVDPAQWADDKFLRENNVYFIFAENDVGKIMNLGKERWICCCCRVNRVDSLVEKRWCFEKIVIGAFNLMNFKKVVWVYL